MSSRRSVGAASRGSAPPRRGAGPPGRGAEGARRGAALADLQHARVRGTPRRRGAAAQAQRTGIDYIDRAEGSRVELLAGIESIRRRRPPDKRQAMRGPGGGAPVRATHYRSGVRLLSAPLETVAFVERKQSFNICTTVLRSRTRRRGARGARAVVDHDRETESNQNRYLRESEKD